MKTKMVKTERSEGQKKVRKMKSSRHEVMIYSLFCACDWRKRPFLTLLPGAFPPLRAE